MPSLFDRVYAYTPVWIQNLGITTYGFVWKRRRFGGSFIKGVAEFSARECFSYEEWQSYQVFQLRELLHSANKSVPYYKSQFNKLGITTEQIDQFDLSQLSTLPALTKDALRLEPSSFLADAVPSRSLHAYSTSGTTGTPLVVMYTSQMHRAWSAAYEARVRLWAGMNHKMSRAMIGGRLVVPQADSKGPFWRYNAAERQLYMSAFHISPENISDYVAALNRFRPDYLVGYASSHFFLARMILESGLNVHKPNAVLTSSEKLEPQMRSVIEQAYACEVFDAYSGVEACCLASECEHHRLHLSPDVGIVEFLDEAGVPVPPGQPGQIVATGLLNHVQPLIRYETGDWAVLSNESCPCGRQMPVITELVGRLEDMVVGRDGREMVRFHGIFIGLPHVREGQVIQETLDKFFLKLVVDPGFNEDEVLTIRKRFYERLGEVDVRIQTVDRIERTNRGKFKAVISHVPRSSLKNQ